MSKVRMNELENRIVKSTIATMVKGCYQCINFEGVENISSLHVKINFDDKSSVKLCTTHFMIFKQRRNNYRKTNPKEELDLEEYLNEIKKILVKYLNEVKETIQNTRIYWDDIVNSFELQDLFKLKDFVININLESEFLLDKINKRLIIEDNSS